MQAGQGEAERPAALGVLMLNTRFPRLKGDVGNPETFPFPVRYRVVEAATPDRVVASPAQLRVLLPDFSAAARALEDEGVGAITTSCGFLVPLQDELAAAVRVPVLTSSLLLLPLIRRLLAPGRAIGVITADAGQLTDAHLAAAGAEPDWPIHVRGMQTSPAFRRAILEDAAELDTAAIAADLVRLCRHLIADHPETAALLFECTNLEAYVPAIRAATGLPTFGLTQALHLLYAGTPPARPGLI